MTKPTNPLTDALPPRARLYLYAVLFVLGLILAAIQATDGDWLKALAYLVAALGGGALPASNVTQLPPGQQTERHRQAS